MLNYQVFIGLHDQDPHLPIWTKERYDNPSSTTFEIPFNCQEGAGFGSDNNGTVGFFDPLAKTWLICHHLRFGGRVHVSWCHLGRTVLEHGGTVVLRAGRINTFAYISVLRGRVWRLVSTSAFHSPGMIKNSSTNITQTHVYTLHIYIYEHIGIWTMFVCRKYFKGT